MDDSERKQNMLDMKLELEILSDNNMNEGVYIIETNKESTVEKSFTETMQDLLKDFSKSE